MRNRIVQVVFAALCSLQAICPVASGQAARGPDVVQQEVNKLVQRLRCAELKGAAKRHGKTLQAPYSPRETPETHKAFMEAAHFFGDLKAGGVILAIVSSPRYTLEDKAAILAGAGSVFAVDDVPALYEAVGSYVELFDVRPPFVPQEVRVVEELSKLTSAALKVKLKPFASPIAPEDLDIPTRVTVQEILPDGKRKVVKSYVEIHPKAKSIPLDVMLEIFDDVEVHPKAKSIPTQPDKKAPKQGRTVTTYQLLEDPKVHDAKLRKRFLKAVDDWWRKAVKQAVKERGEAKSASPLQRVVTYFGKRAGVEADGQPRP